MKILHIAKNIPTKLKAENDIILRTVVNYSSSYDCAVSMVYPLEYVPNVPCLHRLAGRYKEKMLLESSFTYETLTIDVYKYIRLPTKNFSNLLVGVSSRLPCNKQLLDKFKGQVYDVVHSHYLLPDGAIDEPLGIEYKSKFITVRQGDVNKLKQLNSNSLEFKLYEKSIKSATQLISPSYSVKNYIENNFGVKVKIIPHGCYLGKPNFTSCGSRDKIKVVTSANFIPRKNLDWVIKAVNEYSGLINVELIVTGDGPEYQNLVDIASERVSFLGKVSQTENYAIFSNSDLFVLPSQDETFGRVYIEALSCGLPCIALKNTGLYGYPVESAIQFVSSYEQFRDSMFELIENSSKRQKMSKHSVKLAQDLFSWEQVLAAYNELYSSYIDISC